MTDPRDEMIQYLHRLHDDYLGCRMLGHSWRRVDVDVRARRFTFACQSCGSEREDTYSSTGLLEGRSYRMVKGYRKPRTAPGRVALSSVRVEMLRRLMRR